MNKLGSVDVRSAVKIAMNYLHELQDLIPVSDVRLEETEFQGPDWLITLSAVTPRDESSFAAALSTNKRNYKIFRIDGETGEVKSMKVRSLQPVE